jgi:hypothetical protein
MPGTIKQAIIQGLFVFIIIIVLFFCIEIVPLHFGPRHIPFENLMPEIQKRLLRIVLIAFAAALFLGISKKSQKDP